jgi:general secretion pathway protein D
MKRLFLQLSLVLLFSGTSSLALRAGQAPAQAPQADGPAAISLRLDNVDIYQVIDIIGQALDLNYVVDPLVKGTVNISTGTSLQRSDLLPLLETILKINGATMVRSGNIYQIVPASSATRQPLAIQNQPLTAAPAPDDQMIVQVLSMKFVAAAEMERLLRPFLSDGGNIIVQEGGNILLVSDRRSNLRKLLDIVDIFDAAQFAGERVRLMPIKNALARDLVEDLKSVFSGYALSDKVSAIRFLPIERSNSILVITSSPDVFPVVERWIVQLDQPQLAAGMRTFFYKAKHGRAADLVKVLGQLYGSDTRLTAASTPAGQADAGQTAPPVTAGPPLPTPPTQVPQPRSTTDLGVKIIADEVNNALLIQATPPVYADIERTLRELDVQRRQVLIDAQIYEVALDDSTSLGITATLQNRGSGSRSTVASFVAPPGGGAPSLAAQTFAYVGRTRELLTFLNASENKSKVKTLSAPSVLVTDNLEASFQVGAEVPIPTTSSVTPVQSEGTNLFAQTIQFRNTGVILKVKPQVNEGGGVTLEIAQEVSQAGANTTSGIVAPLIGKSSVTSTIVVENGQTIALGGFIRENNDYDRSRIPLIGRVPVVGALFGNTTQSHTRSELIVLVTPHVLQNKDDADLATEELRVRLKEIQNAFK